MVKRKLMDLEFKKSRTSNNTDQSRALLAENGRAQLQCCVVSSLVFVAPFGSFWRDERKQKGLVKVIKGKRHFPERS